MKSPLRRAFPVLGWLLFVAALPVAAQEGDHRHGGPSGAPRPASATPIGAVHFPTSCDPALGPSFDRALALLHSFEYDEARDAFVAAGERDPKCAMTKWGEAMAQYHGLWSQYHADGGARAAAEARRLAAANPATTDREKAYIDAISEVFSDEALKAAQREDNKPGVLGYSEPARAPQMRYREKMAALHAGYPDDEEATVFYALALNITAPRSDKTHADLKQCATLLQPLLAKRPNHPGIAHYLIHCTDNPEMAGEGLEAARRYAAIAPASAHATHMPSHIFAQLGLWDEMVESNRASLKASEEDLHQSACARLGNTLHAMYYLTVALAETGRVAEAKAVAERAKVVSAKDTCDEEPTLVLAGYILETGEWARAREVAVEGRSVPIVEGALWMTIGVGAARTGDVARAAMAEQKLAALRDARAGLPGPTANGAEAMRLAVAGWSAHEAGKKDAGLEALREGADLQDRIGGGNAVLKPVREMLADMLLADGKTKEALAEYRVVLEKQPNRFNALSGAAAAAFESGDVETARRSYGELLRLARGDERPELITARKRLAMAPATAAAADGETEVAGFQQELIAALKQGDRATLERLIAEGFTFVHSTGGLDTRQEYIDSLVSAALAGRSPDIERLDQQVQVFDGHTAVTTSRAILHGRGDDILLRSTHVYVKRGDRWQWAGGQSTKLPTRPKALATLTPAVRDSYAGRYEVGPGRILTVSVKGEALQALLPGFKEAELIPRTETEFAWFNPEVNIEAQVVFLRGEAGTVTDAVYRRDGKEIWRGARVK